MKILKELKSLASSAEDLAEKAKDFSAEAPRSAKLAIDSIIDKLVSVSDLVDEAIGAIEDEDEEDVEDEYM